VFRDELFPRPVFRRAWEALDAGCLAASTSVMLPPRVGQQPVVIVAAQLSGATPK
jgi:hypothetical protein